MSLKKLYLSTGHRLQWEEAQNCMVLLFPEGMIKLNESSAEILNLCDGEHTEENIITVLQRKYKDNDLQSDVHEFLRIALENGWIESK